MVINRRRGSWEHRTFTELPELLDSRDVLVRNDTRVVPARLWGHRAVTGGKWEGLFLREQPGGTWEMLATTRGRPLPGEHVIVGDGLHLILEVQGEDGSWIVRPCLSVGDDDKTQSVLERLVTHRCHLIFDTGMNCRLTGLTTRPFTLNVLARSQHRLPGSILQINSLSDWQLGVLVGSI